MVVFSTFKIVLRLKNDDGSADDVVHVFVIFGTISLLNGLPGTSRKMNRVHVEGGDDVFRQRGAVEHGLHVIGEGAGLGASEGDLEAELAVGADQRTGQWFAYREVLGFVFFETTVQGL